MKENNAILAFSYLNAAIIHLDREIGSCTNSNKFGLKLTHAGSWFVINNPNGKEFINLWRKNVLSTSSIHTESPALTEVLNNSSSDFNYKENEISDLIFGQLHPSMYYNLSRNLRTPPVSWPYIITKEFIIYIFIFFYD